MVTDEVPFPGLSSDGPENRGRFYWFKNTLPYVKLQVAAGPGAQNRECRRFLDCMAWVDATIGWLWSTLRDNQRDGVG